MYTEIGHLLRKVSKFRVGPPVDYTRNLVTFNTEFGHLSRIVKIPETLASWAFPATRARVYKQETNIYKHTEHPQKRLATSFTLNSTPPKGAKSGPETGPWTPPSVAGAAPPRPPYGLRPSVATSPPRGGLRPPPPPTAAAPPTPAPSARSAEKRGLSRRKG